MSGRLDGREQGAEVAALPLPERGASVDPDIPQDPGIPGQKVPDELPSQNEPEVERVPDSDLPDYDEEGQMAPSGDPEPVEPKEDQANFVTFTTRL